MLLRLIPLPILPMPMPMRVLMVIAMDLSLPLPLLIPTTGPTPCLRARVNLRTTNSTHSSPHIRLLGAGPGLPPCTVTGLYRAARPLPMTRPLLVRQLPFPRMSEVGPVGIHTFFQHQKRGVRPRDRVRGRVRGRGPGAGIPPSRIKVPMRH